MNAEDEKRFNRSAHGYGWHFWLTRRIRIGSRRAMTPMWPHVRRSYDEFCNDVLAFHLYPLAAIDVWWRRNQRTEADGICDSCTAELASAAAVVVQETTKDAPG